MPVLLLKGIIYPGFTLLAIALKSFITSTKLIILRDNVDMDEHSKLTFVMNSIKFSISVFQLINLKLSSNSANILFSSDTSSSDSYLGSPTFINFVRKTNLHELIEVNIKASIFFSAANM